MKRLFINLACAAACSSSIAGVPHSEYWTAKAQCWSDLAVTEGAQGDTHGTSVTAEGNAARINAALASSREPSAADEQPIYSKKVWPSTDERYGRPKWRADMLTIDAAVDRYRALQCRTALSACLEVAQASVYENMEESQGARWNHGRPEIDKALMLAANASADLRSCDQPPEPMAISSQVIAQRTLSADVLFDFDSAKLTSAGRSAVLLMVRELAPREGSKLRVVGHTDRFGSDAHNQPLSERRAAAVQKVVAGAAQGAHVDARGVGSKEPVVSCPGKQSKATVACLAPNRRVVIQVLK